MRLRALHVERLGAPRHGVSGYERGEGHALDDEHHRVADTDRVDCYLVRCAFGAGEVGDYRGVQRVGFGLFEWIDECEEVGDFCGYGGVSCERGILRLVEADVQMADLRRFRWCLLARIRCCEDMVSVHVAGRERTDALLIFSNT